MYIDGNILGKYGERHKISGLESLQFTVTSIAEDVRKCVTMEVKHPGDLIYLLGTTKNELGASEYYQRFGYIGTNAPSVDAQGWLPLYQALSTAISQELLASVHAVSRGGLGVHLAQVAFGGGLGLEIDLNKVPVKDSKRIKRNDKILFSESAGRFIVTIPIENQEKFEELFKGTEFACVGSVTEAPKLVIFGLTKPEPGPEQDKVKGEVVNVPIKELKAAWKGTFGGLV
jgi:phosphoribosylformylglycinamidine synthase